MKRTKSDWLLLFDEQQTSGESIAEYCRKNGIKDSAFYSARSRYGITGNQTADDQAVEVLNELAPEPSEQKAQKLDHRCSLTDLDRLIQPEPAFCQVQIAGRPRSGITPGSPPPKTIDFLCNGVPLTVPLSIPDSSLYRLMKVCAAL